MSSNKQQNEDEEQEMSLLKERLHEINGESRAYLKGAAQALLYAQEHEEGDQGSGNGDQGGRL